MIDLLNEILATLRHNKLRTALTGFAVSWGIFLLIVLLSVSRGLVNGMESMFGKRDTESMTIYGGWANKPYHGLKEDRPIELRDKSIEVLTVQNPEYIRDASANLSSDSTVISTSKDYITGGYQGVYPSTQRFEGLTIAEGRFINDSDIREGRKVIVLHKNNADMLFGREYPIGKQVRVGDLSFTVVGIYDHEWQKASYIPFSTARNMSGGSDRLRRITVGLRNVKDQQSSDKAERSVRETLGRQLQFDPDDESALWLWNRFSDYLRTSSAMGAIGLAVWVIGLLTMLSGIVGVSNIMFVSVRERTHEIGVKRAIGARPLSILKQIILESVAITTIFGYVGIVAGVITSQVISHYVGESDFFKNPTVDIAIAIQVTFVLILAGAFAGLFPALKSLKIKPVEALRDE